MFSDKISLEKELETIRYSLFIVRHSLPRLKIAATGGGVLTQYALASIPGCSKFLQGGVYPYSREETVQYLGQTPDKFCSEECAMLLAMKAYQDASQYGQKALGLGISAALITEEDHRRGEKAYVAFFGEDENGQTLAFSILFSFPKLKLKEGEKPEDCRLEERQKQELKIASLVSRILFHYRNLNHETIANLTENGYDCNSAVIWDKERLYNLILKNPLFKANGKREVYNSQKDVFLPCTANPPHEGHFGMAEKTWKQFNRKIIFNLTINPPHKLQVKPHEILMRTKLILQKGYDVLVGFDDGLYIDKIRKYGCDLIMGYDAFQNFLNPKYYYSEEERLKIFQEIKRLNSGIFVFDRQSGDKIETVKMDLIPENLVTSIVRMPYSWNVSSTQIRQELQK